MKKDPKKHLLEHSEVKIKLLRKYLEKYLNIIVNDGYTKSIYLFDLFCGEGIYENGGEGSPLVMLSVVKNLYYSKKAQNKKLCNIELFFNDHDGQKIDKLKKIIDGGKLFVNEIGAIRYGKLTYVEILPKVLKFIKNLKSRKSFIFIDPYGYRDIRASQIKELLESKNSEVLLFLPTQFMYRFDEKGTPQALMEIIEELVDYKHWLPSTSVFNYINQLTNAFRNYLGKDYFVDSFTIQKDPNTVFCLFFFSVHIRGFEKMLETKWELDEEEGRGFSFERTGNLFDTEKILGFEENLSNFLKEIRSNSEIYCFTLSNGFLPKHVNEILKKMESENKIHSEIPKRKNAYYISYENYRDNPQKIKIRLV